MLLCTHDSRHTVIPFAMTRQRGGRYRAGMREDVCSAYSEWLRLRTVPAERILASREAPAAVRRADGSAYPADIAPRASQSKMTGDMAITALKAVLSSAAENGDKVVRLVCSYDCRQGEQCHGATLVEEATALIAAHDAAAPRAPPASNAKRGRGRGGPPRPPRKDKGVPRGPRGPRALKGDVASRIGRLSLLRFRHGNDRQVSAATRAAVAAATSTGIAPWLAHDAPADSSAAVDSSDERRGSASDAVNADAAGGAAAATCSGDGCDDESCTDASDAAGQWGLDDADGDAAVAGGYQHWRRTQSGARKRKARNERGQHSQRDKREAEDYEQQHGSTGHGSDGGPSSGNSGAAGGATASGSRGRGSTAGRDSTAAQGGGRRQEQQPGAAEAPTERKKRRGTQASSRKRQLLAGMQAAAAAAQLRDSAE